MKMITLVENTTQSPDLKQKHGVCFYIETENHKILFDLRPDRTFWDNGKKLGVDIGSVDTVIISHGHRDHGGALELFLQHNKQAKVYIQESAFEPHYIKMLFLSFSVGLNADLKTHNRIHLVKGDLKIDKELFLLANIEGQFATKGNQALLGKDKKTDGFHHEQNLLIQHGDKNVLFTGCSHRGILNIMLSVQRIVSNIDIVIGGFHLYNPVNKRVESEQLVKAVALELIGKASVFYTCHCTGKKAYAIMKLIMGEQLQALSTGCQMTV